MSAYTAHRPGGRKWLFAEVAVNHLGVGRLVSGGFQYKAPGGGHDDCVTRKSAGTFRMALAIVWDSLRVMERRFEAVMIEGKDPVEEIDNEKGV